MVEATKRTAIDSSDDWVCKTCGETVPQSFKVCWHCGRDQDGNVQVDIQAARNIPQRERVRKFHPRLGLCILSAGAAWAVVVVCAVIVAFLLDGDMNQQWPTSAIVFGSIGSVAMAIAVAASFAVLAFVISPLRFTWPRDEPDSD